MPDRDLDLDRIAATSAQAFISLASIGVVGDHLEVFGVTFAGELRHRWHDGHWSAWTKMPMPHGTHAAHVGAAAHGRYVDLFLVTSSGQLFHRWWGDSVGWSAWSDWGGGFTGPIAVASGGEGHNELWLRRGGTVIHKWLTDGTWSDWHEFA